MEVKQVTAVALKQGSFVLLEGAACRIADVSISKSGKHGHSKVRIVAIGLLDDKKRDVVMPGQSSVEVPIIEKRTAQVISVTSDTANVMDTETYETLELKIPEDMKGKIEENGQVMYWIIAGQKVIKQAKGGE
ncbi:translation initiation factor IF-5A [Candidatus Woesearchaeota archaeon]|nr:translation initiation factor IF-5A [Candidatus Woesearchaeota archaeon]